MESRRQNSNCAALGQVPGSPRPPTWSGLFHRRLLSAISIARSIARCAGIRALLLDITLRTKLARPLFAPEID